MAQATPSLSLTDEQRMLIQIRDVLYEGSWDDFLSDLRARAGGRPHVFATVPVSPELQDTISRHIGLIAQMQSWEHQHNHVLTPR